MFTWSMNNKFMDMLDKLVVVFLDNILIYSKSVKKLRTPEDSIYMLM